MSVLLEARGLRRRFRSGDVGWLDVLLDVELIVQRGEVIAIAGASGSVLTRDGDHLAALDDELHVQQHVEPADVAGAEPPAQAASPPAAASFVPDRLDRLEPRRRRAG